MHTFINSLACDHHTLRSRKHPPFFPGYDVRSIAGGKVMALGPGSIAFIGFNADGNDNVAFVTLPSGGPELSYSLPTMNGPDRRSHRRIQIHVEGERHRRCRNNRNDR